ncbi:signal recognition particle receptor subunit alpha isoform X3 [Phyllopteryx taeniolatus]|uniref:signal recognition particle receptor subunit alpha isoform X3 n=1 Tax=Phyllopteryx taeniolatus TaxID=161469 RepID=UPI002AD4035A|nr:signal recognition particle receptor subunit alpha isoform X3 [Phyllopteryx taeniolatus]
MLDFFTIFSKGGIVLWCFQGTGVPESFTGPVNALIRSVILQVGFQKILTLTYVDKLIDDVQLNFRDRYKNELEQKGAMKLLNHSFEFEGDFKMLLREAEEGSKARSPAPMRSFKESEKSQKTVKSMIEIKGGEKEKEQGSKKSKNTKKEADQGKGTSSAPKLVENGNHGLTAEEIMQKKREEFFRKRTAGPAEKVSKSPKPQKPREKQRRVWDMGGSSTKDLDYSDKNGESSPNGCDQNQDAPIDAGVQLNSMKGDLPSVECDSSDDDEEEEEEEEERVVVNATLKTSGKKSGGFGGMFGMLKGLVGSKSLNLEDMEPVLEKMRDHLIAKNVAAEIASQLCDSVAKKLEGKVMGTFTTVASTVKQALQESLVQILQPKRRVDILRDVMETQSQRRPFVITFCGVNGVGKSTNLAKISFWLIENGFTVLIAACDTFRAGAVEQLRTHQRRLNSLHPPEKHGGRTMVQLYEKGYGKDAAGIAMEAIAYARNQAFDVVLVDTAGRMQDNAPLMTALAKLIAVNMPDLVLFVGEALVGNEAVDQLVKFNQALADHSMSDKPRLIDGIVLTKFDTIDDKVGAAISMTYITGQPIVFVGTGQTYNDLRSLNARAVVSALMKA